MTESPAATALAALRERGAQRVDPVRFCFIEALARRAGAQQGAARAVLDARLDALLAEYQQRLEQPRGLAAHDAAQPAASTTAATPTQAPAMSSKPASDRAAPSPLAGLLEHLAASAASHDDDAGGGGASTDRSTGEGQGPGSPTELKTLRHFRSTWSQLSVDLRLTPARAKVPDNAGPLNSHMLALRSLKLMRELSPEYLNRFMSYLDALQWLDQSQGDPGPPAKAAARGDNDKPRRPARKRAG